MLRKVENKIVSTKEYLLKLNNKYKARLCNQRTNINKQIIKSPFNLIIWIWLQFDFYLKWQFYRKSSCRQSYSTVIVSLSHSLYFSFFVDNPWKHKKKWKNSKKNNRNYLQHHFIYFTKICLNTNCAAF